MLSTLDFGPSWPRLGGQFGFLLACILEEHGRPTSVFFCSGRSSSVLFVLRWSPGLTLERYDLLCEQENTFCGHTPCSWYKSMLYVHSLVSDLQQRICDLKAVLGRSKTWMSCSRPVQNHVFTVFCFPDKHPADIDLLFLLHEAHVKLTCPSAWF